MISARLMIRSISEKVRDGWDAIAPVGAGRDARATPELLRFAGFETVTDSWFGFDQARFGGGGFDFLADCKGLSNLDNLFRAVLWRGQKVRRASIAAVNIVSSLESLNGWVPLKEWSTRSSGRRVRPVSGFGTGGLKSIPIVKAP